MKLAQSTHNRDNDVVRIYPDWRVALARPEVRKAVLSGRGFHHLREVDRPVAEQLRDHISKDTTGRPLARDERLRRIDDLSRRQAWSAYAVLAKHLWQTSVDFGFTLLNGQSVKFMVLFTPYELSLKCRGLSVQVFGEPFRPQLVRDRPDLALRWWERALRQAEEIIANPSTFPGARATLTADAEKYRAHISRLKNQAPYAGRGRRAIVDDAVLAALADSVTRWLEGHITLLRSKIRSAQFRSGEEAWRAAAALAKRQDLRFGRMNPEVVHRILFARPRQSTRTRAIHLVAQGLGFSPNAVRKSLRIHGSKRPSS